MNYIFIFIIVITIILIIYKLQIQYEGFNDDGCTWNAHGCRHCGDIGQPKCELPDDYLTFSQHTGKKRKAWKHYVCCAKRPGLEWTRSGHGGGCKKGFPHRREEAKGSRGVCKKHMINEAKKDEKKKQKAEEKAAKAYARYIKKLAKEMAKQKKKQDKNARDAQKWIFYNEKDDGILNYSDIGEFHCDLLENHQWLTEWGDYKDGRFINVTSGKNDPNRKGNLNGMWWVQGYEKYKVKPLSNGHIDCKAASKCDAPLDNICQKKSDNSGKARRSAFRAKQKQNKQEKKENIGRGGATQKVYCPSQFNPRYFKGDGISTQDSITKWKGDQYKWTAKCNPNFNFSDDLKSLIEDQTKINCEILKKTDAECAELIKQNTSEHNIAKSCQAFKLDCNSQLEAEGRFKEDQDNEIDNTTFKKYDDLNEIEIKYENIIKNLVDEKGNSFMVNNFCDIGCKSYLGKGKIRSRKTEYKQCVSKCNGCKAARGIKKAFAVAAIITSAIFPIGTLIAGLTMTIGQQIGDNISGNYGNCNTWKDNLLKIRQARLTNEQQWKSKYSGRNAFNYDKRQWNSPNERDGIPAGFCLPKGADKKWCSSGKVILADGKNKYGFHDVNGLYRKEMVKEDLKRTGGLWEYEARDGKIINYDINPIYNITLEELFLDVFDEVTYKRPISDDLTKTETVNAKARLNKINLKRKAFNKELLCINKEKYKIIELIKSKWDLKDIEFYSYWEKYLHGFNSNIISSNNFKERVTKHVEKYDIPTQLVINEIDKGNKKFKDSNKCNKENADEGCIDPRKHYKTADILKKREWSAEHKQYQGLKALFLNFTTLNYFESFNTNNDKIKKSLLDSSKSNEARKKARGGNTGNTCNNSNVLYNIDSVDCETQLIHPTEISNEDRNVRIVSSSGREQAIIGDVYDGVQHDRTNSCKKYASGGSNENIQDWKECMYKIYYTPCNNGHYNRHLWKCTRANAEGIPKALGHPIHHFKYNNLKGNKFTGQKINTELGTYKELDNYNKTKSGKDWTIRYVTCKKHGTGQNKHYDDKTNISRTTNQYTNWSPLCSDKQSCSINSMAGKEAKLDSWVKNWDSIKTTVNLDESKHDLGMLSECQNAQLYIITMVNEAYKDEIRKSVYPKMINLIEKYWDYMNFKPYKYKASGKYYDDNGNTHIPDSSGKIGDNPIIAVACGKDELGATRNYKCKSGNPIHFSKWGKGRGDGYGQTDLSLGNTKWMNNLFSAATCLGSMGAGAVVKAYNLSPQGYSLLANKTNEIISTSGELKAPKLITKLSGEILSRGTKSQCDNDKECSQIQTNIDNSIDSLIKKSPNKIYNYDPNSSDWQNIVSDHYKTVIDGAYSGLKDDNITQFKKMIPILYKKLKFFIANRKRCYKIKNRRNRNYCIYNINKKIRSVLKIINIYKTKIKNLEDQTFDDYCNA